MKDLTTKAADNIRILAASMVEKAKSGHPGGAMGGADFVNILYSEFLRYNPDDSRYPFRDRFFLDPGHMSRDAVFRTGSGRLFQYGRVGGVPAVGQPDAGSSRGRSRPRDREYLGPAGAGPCDGFGCGDRRAFSRSSLRRLDGAQDLRVHLRRRYSGRGFSGRRPHRRASRAEQPDHVLRLEQYPAFDQGRGGFDRRYRGQVRGLGLERHQYRRQRSLRNPSGSLPRGGGDRKAYADRRPYADGQGRRRQGGRGFLEQGFHARTASVGCGRRHRQDGGRAGRRSGESVRDFRRREGTVCASPRGTEKMVRAAPRGRVDLARCQ